MSTEKSLLAKKQEILKNWFEATVATYPPDTARFLKSHKDPFTNPVGETTYRSLTVLVDALMNGADRDVMTAALDPVMRIRAVQAFSPSMATGFVFSLKQIVRQHLAADSGSRNKTLAELDQRIDEMALAAFDIYMACREKIYELKATESRNQFFSSLKRAGLIADSEADGEASADGPGL
ncbi:RsbRD N-terminal domain-containing protein [Desulfosarcina sp. OttesenSCG-928-A07]|nr:RsbRD N-terminal domain-containing protein [Desulfosarcina sp. OttesenSCG-928-G17]MDL2329368.1 RsbRD N-terminal domain-containing protein [Desulfosarcina sp. OttesenSCG-928-A07]